MVKVYFYETIFKRNQPYHFQISKLNTKSNLQTKFEIIDLRQQQNGHLFVTGVRILQREFPI